MKKAHSPGNLGSGTPRPSTSRAAKRVSTPEQLAKHRKPYWDRPADSSIRQKAAEIVALKVAGKTRAEIAVIVGLQADTIKRYLYLAAKNGWLKFDDPTERLEYELLPKIVDNIAYHLNKKDKTMTIEAAKGTGLFKSHQAIKTETEAPQTVLTLNIEMPTDPAAVLKLIPAGAMLGQAKSK